MKSLKPFWIPGLLALMVFLCAGGAVAQPGPRASYQTFYDELEPYGRWMQNGRYGYVWVPDAGPDFQPYATAGHWVVTEYGNTWVSDYEWGWAPFHYGRWFYDDYYGWTWVPDQEWGPAWVSWRNGGGYYGWAPLAPGMGISSYDIPVNQWCFVPEVYLVRPRIITYCVPRPRVVVIYRDTRHLNNIYRYGNRDYVYGPRREEIERVTRSRVDVYHVNHGDRPGRAQVQDRSVRIYRPEVYQDQQERSRPRSVAVIAPRRDRNDGIPASNADGSARGRVQDRAAAIYNGAGDRRPEERRAGENPVTDRGYQPDRNLPSRGTRGQEPVLSPNGAGSYSGPGASGNGRERMHTDTRISRELPMGRGSQLNAPASPAINQGRERESRVIPQREETQPARENPSGAAGYPSRRREALGAGQGGSAIQTPRERPTGSSRTLPGRSRRE